MSDRKKEQAVERALTEGYEKYYRLAYSYVHNEADALDIVQEAAYKAILKSDSLKEPQYVETWVYRIVINEACSFLRSRRTERESSALETPCSAVTASPAMGMTRTPKRVTQTPSSMESTIYAADPMLRAMP